MSFRSLLLCLALFAISPLAIGADLAEVRRQIESSLLVQGTIRIDAAGHVQGYTLDQPERVPKGIAAMIERMAPAWTFEPVALADGTVSRSRMSLLFVAKKQDDGKMRIELRSASFEAELPENERVTVARRNRSPEYPPYLAAREVGGIVYLALQIGRDGKVMNIEAAQVNLRTLGSEPEMSRWRSLFAAECIRAVRLWTFTPPTAGEAANAPYWFGTIVLDFTPDDRIKPPSRPWQTYLPGPTKPMPWANTAGLVADNTDALPPGGFHMAGNDRRLLSPLMTP